jgi:uncharacterized protein with HEPN domain
MSERNFHLYLTDILESGSAILEFTKGMSFEKFSNDRKTCSAVIRELEIIGEAVGKLPDEVKQKHLDVEWQDIKDFRNLLIHEYFGVDLEIVWKVIQDDLPGLMNSVKEMMKEAPHYPIAGQK